VSEDGVDRRLILFFILSFIKEKLTKRDDNRNAHCLRAQELPKARTSKYHKTDKGETGAEEKKAFLV